MEKINVLVLPSDQSGVGKFRSVDPHVKLQNMFSEEFHVDIDYQPKVNDINFWKQYRIVHIHRNIGQSYEQTLEIMDLLKKLDIRVIVDLDDYWLPTPDHPIHQLILQNKVHEKIKNNLKASSYVITTTEIFADEIKKINKDEIFKVKKLSIKEKIFRIFGYGKKR
mgnify:CR=1 FL=1